MASDRREIANQMITLMKANTAFDAIQGYIVGSVFKIPIAQKKALCEVSLELMNIEYRTTGYVEQVFTGAAVFTVLQPDSLTFTAKVAVSASQEAVQDYADSFLAQFLDVDNLTLGSLVCTSGARVQEIRILDGVTYMPAIRNDSFTSMADIPFSVRIEKVRT